MRHSAVYSLVGICSRLLSFVLLPVYTRHLTTADYGIMELLATTTVFIGALAGGRFTDALTNTYFNATSDDERRHAITTGFLGMTLCGALVALLGCLFAPQVSSLVFGDIGEAGYFRLAVINLGLTFPTEAALAYVRALNRSGLYSGLQIAQNALVAAITVVLLVGFGFGIWAFMISAVVAGSAAFLYLAWFVVSRCGCGFRYSIFRAQVKFALPLVLGPAGMVVMHYGDRTFLLRSVSLADIGIYSLAYRIGMLLPYFVGPVTIYWRSQMYEILKAGDEKMYARLSTYFVLFVTVLTLGISVSARGAVALLAAPPFHRAAIYVPLVALGYSMFSSSEFFRSILLRAGAPGREGRVLLVTTIFCVAAYAILIPHFKVWGAAAATASTFAVLLFYGQQQAQAVHPTAFETTRIAKILASAVFCFAGYSLLPAAGFWVEAAKCVLVMLAFGGLLFVTRFFEPNEIRQARRFLPAAR